MELTITINFKNNQHCTKTLKEMQPRNFNELITRIKSEFGLLDFDQNFDEIKIGDDYIEDEDTFDGYILIDNEPKSLTIQFNVEMPEAKESIPPTEEVKEEEKKEDVKEDEKEEEEFEKELENLEYNGPINIADKKKVILNVIQKMIEEKFKKVEQEIKKSYYQRFEELKTSVQDSMKNFQETINQNLIEKVNSVSEINNGNVKDSDKNENKGRYEKILNFMEEIKSSINNLKEEAEKIKNTDPTVANNIDFKNDLIKRIQKEEQAKFQGNPPANKDGNSSQDYMKKNQPKKKPEIEQKVDPEIKLEENPGTKAADVFVMNEDENIAINDINIKESFLDHKSDDKHKKTDKIIHNQINNPSGQQTKNDIFNEDNINPMPGFSNDGPFAKNSPNGPFNNNGSDLFNQGPFGNNAPNGPFNNDNSTDPFKKGPTGNNAPNDPFNNKNPDPFNQASKGNSDPFGNPNVFGNNTSAKQDEFGNPNPFGNNSNQQGPFANPNPKPDSNQGNKSANTITDKEKEFLKNKMNEMNYIKIVRKE